MLRSKHHLQLLKTGRGKQTFNYIFEKNCLNFELSRRSAMKQLIRQQRAAFVIMPLYFRK